MFYKFESKCWVLVLTCLLVACGGDGPSQQALAPGATVLALGDSITYGTGAGPGEGYPEKLAALTGLQVVNAGIPGDTAREALARIKAQLAEHQPALMILELGGNDFLRQRQANKVKEDLRSMIRSAREAGVEVLLVAVPRLSLARAQLGMLEDSVIYRELADEEGVSLFADELSAILSEDALRADRIHPNAAGYEQLARSLADFMMAVGFL